MFLYIIDTMRKFLGIIVIILILFVQTAKVQAEPSLRLQLKDNILPTDSTAPIEYVKQEESEEQNNIPYQFQPPENIVYMDNQHIINFIDPVKTNESNSYYPGLRGPNQLIVYTPKYGVRTGTNEFGTEAIVVNNMVVSLNGADSIIPYNGFVISGHGSAKNWILKNVQVGSKIYIDYYNSTIRVLLTPESLIFAAKEKLNEINGIVDYYKQNNTAYTDKKTDTYISSSLNLLKKAEKKPEKTQQYITEAMESLDNAIKNAIPYYPDELKGVWIRPVEKTASQIEKTLDRLSDAGFTDIFLETYYHGKTIYPSEHLRRYGVRYQREEFIGFDPLAIWIKEAHKRQMKIHVWFETFYVGNENPQTTPNHVLSVYPMWSNKRLLNYDSETPVFSLSEHNGYFLDPANPQVQEYVLGLIQEIVEKYDIDGINLDYIRYPQCVDESFSNYRSSNWGYTNAAREEFQYIYGIDPIDIEYGTYEWQLWCIYRQNKISKFLVGVRNITANKNIKITAVIFPDLKKCISTKMQNWRNWAIHNYVDGFTPLILTGDKNTAIMLLNDVIRNTTSKTKIYPGLFVTFMGGSFEDLLLQIHKTRVFKAKGTVLFDYAHLNDTYIDALTTRVFNKSYESKEFKDKTSETYQPQVIYKDNKKRREINARD